MCAKMEQTTAASRLGTLLGQVVPQEQDGGLEINPTSANATPAGCASCPETSSYSVALPEKLTADGPWNVYRYTLN